MIELENKGFNERFGLCNETHDDLHFHCRVELVEECLFEVKRIMRAPTPTLMDPLVAPAGLWCEVECKVGPSLAELQEVQVS